MDSAATELSQDMLAARLRRTRLRLNISQERVAAAVGIGRAAVSSIERGTRKVDSLELRAFSRLYRYPLDDLLNLPPHPGASWAALNRALTNMAPDDIARVRRFAEFLGQERNRQNIHRGAQ